MQHGAPRMSFRRRDESSDIELRYAMQNLDDHTRFPAPPHKLRGRAEIARPSPQLPLLYSRYEPAFKVKSRLFVSPDPTVICCVTGSSPSCHACREYVPGGKPLISKLPSLPVTAK